MQSFSSGVKVCTLLLKELLHVFCLFVGPIQLHLIPQVHYLPFFFYNNDLPKIIKINSEPVLFADDASLIITKPSPIDFKVDITTAYVRMNKWFNANSLFFKLKKCITYIS